MIPAPIPGNEVERLTALRELLVLDTPPEERYDRIVQFAAREFGVPMALIALLDSDRQWFKASVGMNVCETARDISFCGHAIMTPSTMVISDALLDVRFMGNPLVLGAPHIRFYAGAPLRLPGGEAVGTLCILDCVPCTLDRIGLATLGALRALVVEQLVEPEVVV